MATCFLSLRAGVCSRHGAHVFSRFLTFSLVACPSQRAPAKRVGPRAQRAVTPERVCGHTRMGVKRLSRPKPDARRAIGASGFGRAEQAILSHLRDARDGAHTLAMSLPAGTGNL
jgi:hypothetical protein